MAEVGASHKRGVRIYGSAHNTSNCNRAYFSTSSIYPDVLTSPNIVENRPLPPHAALTKLLQRVLPSRSLESSASAQRRPQRSSRSWEGKDALRTSAPLLVPHHRLRAGLGVRGRACRSPTNPSSGGNEGPGPVTATAGSGIPAPTSKDYHENQIESRRRQWLLCLFFLP